MTEADARNPLARWFRANATQLESIDPDADLADLEGLERIVDGARVVALGENAHFTREFALLRRRLLRFLVERCGFTVLAFESGFSEGFEVDAWVQGAGHDDDLGRLAETGFPSGTARAREVRDGFRRLRAYNRTADSPVRFIGVDVPEAAGSLLQALDPVTAYLERVDSAALPLLAEARELSREPAGRTMAQAAPRYLEVPRDRQDALTAVLSRLVDRFDALAPEYVAASDRESFDIARWRLEAARAGDHHLHAIAGAYAGTALPASATARERYLAASVAWWRERLDPDNRIVLMAHNAHIQRTPVVYAGELQVLPMGLHLGRMLGDEYCAVGFTSSSGRTAALDPDGTTEPYGFAVGDVELEPPEPGSIEAALSAAGVGLGLADLRAARRAVDDPGTLPDRVRLDSDYIHTPVLEAFDAMLHVPSTSLAQDLGF